MSIIFNPNGALDISTDSADLPEQVDGKTAISGAMRRCTNLSLDSAGIASTRKGTSKINSTAIAAPSKIVEQGGDRYSLGTSIYRNESSIGSGYSNSWSAVLYNPFTVLTQTIYALNGTDRKKIEGSTIYEWGIDAPTVGPTVSKGASYACWTLTDIAGLTGNNWLFTTAASDGSYTTYAWESAMIDNADSLFPEATSYTDTYFFENVVDYGVTGKYEIVYTYARFDSGGVLICESSQSPATETAIESNANVYWTIPSDTQITHVKIYRSIANTAGSWYFAGVFAVADGNGTISARDDELGTAVETTHHRPPAGHTVIGPSLGGQLYILIDNNLYYCLPNQPEYWPLTYYLEITAPQFPLMAGCFFGGNLFIASEHEIFLISGSGASSYFAQPMSAVTGTKSKNCFLAVKGVGIFHLGTDGIYLYTSGQDTSLTDAGFKPIFEGETVEDIPGMNRDNIANCIMEQYLNKLWFGYPAIGETYCKDFLVMDLESKRVVHYQYPFAVKCLSIDHQNNRILAGDEDGYVRVIDELGQTTDDGTDIDYDLSSKEFVQFPKYFPRYARWDVDLGDDATATGEVLLEGDLKQSHPITVSRNTRKRLITTCTGTRMSVRVHGSGPVDIRGVEIE